VPAAGVEIPLRIAFGEAADEEGTTSATIAIDPTIEPEEEPNRREGGQRPDGCAGIEL
jgi:hypothetical protein